MQVLKNACVRYIQNQLNWWVTSDTGIMLQKSLCHPLCWRFTVKEIWWSQSRHAYCSFMSVCLICLEKWINIMQGFRELRNPILAWDIHVIVWRCRYHDVCENLWPLLLHGEDSRWICYKIFRFHKSTKVILKILQCFSRMISIITMIQTKYLLNTGSENCQMIMTATRPFSVQQNVFICALQIM